MQMKGRFLLTVIFLLVLCLALSGCGASFPLQNVEIDNQPVDTYSIYVSGAVERDGYYEIDSGTTYTQLFQLAGLLPETVLPAFYTTPIDGSITRIILNYYDGEIACDSINANSPLIAARIPVNGLTEDVIDKLADYIEQYGKIHTRQQLQAALGDDYADNFYKLFVAEEDYENAD